MNKELIEKAKKYKIALTERASVALTGNSAKEWSKTIENFLTRFCLLDASIEIETDGCYECSGCLSNICVQATVDRSEEAIQKDIDNRLALEKFKRQEARERSKKRREEEISSLKRLKQKYPNE